MSSFTKSEIIENVEKIFDNENVSNLYLLYRPGYPSKVIDIIVDKCCLDKNKGLKNPLGIIADVGCGSGQLTELLAPFADKIFASDISNTQISQAKTQSKSHNVEYIVGSSDNLQLNNASVDLISVAKVLHWLNRDLFYKEVDRCLKPGGHFLAITSHIASVISDDPSTQFKLDQLRQKVLVEGLEIKYGPSCLQFNRDKFLNMPMPYNNQQRFEIFQELEFTSHSLMCYILTVSSCIIYGKQGGDMTQFVDDYVKQVLQCLGLSVDDDTTKLRVRFPLVVIITEKPRPT